MDRPAKYGHEYRCAYGDDPLLVDPRGHTWAEVHREQRVWSDHVTSWQQCSACSAVREVVLVQGPGGCKRLTGIQGFHGWVSALLRKNGDATCDHTPLPEGGA